MFTTNQKSMFFVLAFLLTIVIFGNITIDTSSTVSYIVYGLLALTAVSFYRNKIAKN